MTTETQAAMLFEKPEHAKAGVFHVNKPIRPGAVRAIGDRGA